MANYVSDEIASQPRCWRTVAALPELGRKLPDDGARVAVVGCGTSWFIAMAYAALRESEGRGETDAFAASEFPSGRDYDVIVAISRSGITTEVAELLTRENGSTSTVAVVGVPNTPVAEAADDTILLDFADERSVVQTRYATTVLALVRSQLGHDIEPIALAAEQALAAEVPAAALDAEQITFLGRGWTVGLAHEAALKLREASQSWAESYPAMDYRHGPIAIAAPGRLVWAFGPMPAGLQVDVQRTGAGWLADDRDPMAQLVLAQRAAMARAERAGLDPDRPRALSRSVVLDSH